MGSPFGGQKAGKVPKASEAEKALEQVILPLVLSILYENPEDILSALASTSQTTSKSKPLTKEEFFKEKGEEARKIHEETGKSYDQIYQEYRQSFKPEEAGKEGGTLIDLITNNILTKYKKDIDEIEKMIAGMSEKEKEELAPIIEDYERYREMFEEIPELEQMQGILKSGVPLSIGGRYVGSAFPARRAEATLRAAETRLKQGNLLRLLLGEQAETIAHPYDRLLQEAAQRAQLAGARLGLFEYPYGLYKSLFTARYGVPPVQTTGWLTGLMSAMASGAQAYSGFKNP